MAHPYVFGMGVVTTAVAGRLPQADADALKRLAAERDVTLSHLVGTILRDYAREHPATP